MYAFFALEGESDARRACADILEKAHVGLAPGYLFGSSANAFLRMCVCRDAAQIETALERMLDHEELTLREAAGRQENRARRNLAGSTTRGNENELYPSQPAHLRRRRRHRRRPGRRLRRRTC